MEEEEEMGDEEEGDMGDEGLAESLDQCELDEGWTTVGKPQQQQQQQQPQQIDHVLAPCKGKSEK